jgi:hypothetical protein
MKRMQFVVLAGIALALIFATSPAQAQKAKAKKLFDQGVAAMEEYDYKGALASFADAYKAAPHWAVLAHIGLCHAKLNQPVDSIKAYEQYLKDGGDDIPADQKDSARKALEEQKRKVGTLILLVKPSDAKVKIDGDDIGSPPFEEILLKAGPHHILVIRDGVEEERDISIYSGKELTVKMYPKDDAVAVAPVPAPAPPQKAEPKPEPQPEPEPEPEPAPEPEPEPEPAPTEGTLAVNANVEGAAVAVNGEAAGEVPYEGTHPAGPLSLGVTAEGYAPFSRDLVLQGGMRTGLEVTLVGEDEQPERLSIPFWIAAGVGAVGLVGTGVGFGVFAYNKNSANNYADAISHDVFSGYTWDGNCSDGQVSPGTEKYYCETEWARRDYEDKSKVGLAIGIPSAILFAAGGTMAALFYFKPEWFFGVESDAEITISPLATGDQTGLLLGGRF